MPHGNKTHCDKCGNPFRKTSHPVTVSYKSWGWTKTKLCYYCPSCEALRARRQSAAANKKQEGGCSGCIYQLLVFAVIGSLLSTFCNDSSQSDQAESLPQTIPSQEKKWPGRDFGTGGLSGFKSPSHDKTSTENPDEEDEPKPSPPPTQIQPSTDGQ